MSIEFIPRPTRVRVVSAVVVRELTIALRDARYAAGPQP
ncbi:MAG: hypothetical protein JWP66_905 [Naasia sp.]|nr:hypothetical protein [Naasia sp.]